MASQAIATLETRARAKPSAPDAQRATSGSWLLFRAAAHVCAVPLEHVIETMRPLPIAPVAGAPDYVRGLCIIRGAAVPVVDAGRMLGGRALEAERLIAIRIDGRVVALATGAIIGIQAIAAEMLAALPPLLREAAHETVEAITTLDAELLIFLRSSHILPADLIDRLTAAGAAP